MEDKGDDWVGMNGEGRVEGEVPIDDLNCVCMYGWSGK